MHQNYIVLLSRDMLDFVNQKIISGIKCVKPFNGASAQNATVLYVLIKCAVRGYENRLDFFFYMLLLSSSGL